MGNLIDREEVIKQLENDAIATDTGYVEVPLWLFSEILALLKEQDAVEPIPFFTETGAESPYYVICGHCKSIKSIMLKCTKQKYCHECGKAVKWE